MAVKNYQNGVVILECPVCNQDTAHELPVDYEPRYLEEFGQYENLSVPCQICEAEGRQVTNVVNINLPEFDEMELDVIEELAPAEEVISRQTVRDIMWNKRSDLKGKDRIKAREDYVMKNQERIDRTREEIRIRKENREGIIAK